MRQRDFPFSPPVGGTNPDSVFFQDEFETGNGPHPLVTPIGIPGYQALIPHWLTWAGANVTGGLAGSTGIQDAAAQRALAIVDVPLVGGEAWGGQLVSMVNRVPQTDWAAFLYGRVGSLFAGFPQPLLEAQRCAVIVATNDVLAAETSFDTTGIQIDVDGAGPLAAFRTFSASWPSSSGPPFDEVAFGTESMLLSTWVRYLMLYSVSEDELVLFAQVSPDGLGWYNLRQKTYPGNLRYIGFGTSGLNQAVPELLTQGRVWCDYLRLLRQPFGEQVTLVQAILSTAGGRNYPGI